MLKFISGQDLLKRWNILPIQLFDYVKNGLQPFDEFLNPVLPTDITDKQEQLKKLKKTLEFTSLLIKPWGAPKKAIYKSERLLKKIQHIQDSFTSLHESKLSDAATLKNELDSIGNKYSWLAYELPDDKKTAEMDFGLLRKSYYSMEDIGEIENTLRPKESELQPHIITTATPPIATAINTANFFKRSEGEWLIGFEGKNAKLDHILGLLYIAYLLDKPGESISCRDLYQVASGKMPDNIMSKGAAIDEGLNIGRLIQSIGTGKERKIALKAYQELEEELPMVSMEEQEEIREEMAKLKPFLNLKERNFAEPHDVNAQINIMKCLKRAYAKIAQKSINNLAEHLGTYIKTDEAYGLRYIGSTIWDITF